MIRVTEETRKPIIFRLEESDKLNLEDTSRASGFKTLQDFLEFITIEAIHAAPPEVKAIVAQIQTQRAKQQASHDGRTAEASTSDLKPGSRSVQAKRKRANKDSDEMEDAA